MSNSNIVFKINYKTCKNKKVGIKGWLDYASKNKKPILLASMNIIF